LSQPVSIPFSAPNITEREKQYVAQAIQSGWVGSKGDFIDRFESRLAKWQGIDYAVTCNSGTSALFLTYVALGMKPESKVVTTSQTFAATYNMARVLSHNVTLVQPDHATWNLQPQAIDNCDFFVAVHLYGMPCDMGQLYRAKFVCIEDCAQAMGSKWKGKRVGSFGKVSCFSFHSAKTITTGEGGACMTNDKSLADRIRHLRNHCMTSPYKHDNIGWNLKLTNIQAALGLAQLERIDELLDKKKAMARFYDENLSPAFKRQAVTRNSDVVKWACAYANPYASLIREKMKAGGIETRPGFNREDIIVLPCSTTLTRSDLETVVKLANACIT